MNTENNMPVKLCFIRLTTEELLTLLRPAYGLINLICIYPVEQHKCYQ